MDRLLNLAESPFPHVWDRKVSVFSSRGVGVLNGLTQAEYSDRAGPCSTLGWGMGAVIISTMISLVTHTPGPTPSLSIWGSTIS